MGWLEDFEQRPTDSVASAYGNVASGAANASGQYLHFVMGGTTGDVLKNALNGKGLSTAQGSSGSADVSLSGDNAAARQADLDAGYAKGHQEFYDDPDMQDLRARREDLAQGYDGQTLGALREQSRSDLAGQQSKYVQQLQGNLGKGGVGGARAAAITNQANTGFAANRAANERAIDIDQAKQVRQGTSDLQDFLMRQKEGELGTGIGYGQLGVADRTAAAQTAIANKQPDKGILGNIFGSWM